MTPKEFAFPEDSKVHFQLLSRIPRGSSDWYWGILYPDEFAFYNSVAHMGFPESDREICQFIVGYRYKGYTTYQGLERSHQDPGVVSHFTFHISFGGIIRKGEKNCSRRRSPVISRVSVFPSIINVASPSDTSFFFVHTPSHKVVCPA